MGRRSTYCHSELATLDTQLHHWMEISTDVEGEEKEGRISGTAPLCLLEGEGHGTFYDSSAFEEVVWSLRSLIPTHLHARREGQGHTHSLC